jgi:putative ABC transport system substrate-binding protein
MKRREFIAGLGSAAAWPLSARAQQSAIPVIGLLSSASPGPFASRLRAFHQGLQEAGYVEGQNVTIEFRWAEDQYDRLPALAADLVRSEVAVIVAAGGPVTALAAKGATATIPIVFVSGDDPVRYGLVASLNRPGGNVTGAVFFSAGLAAKRLELLRHLVPGTSVVGYLVNPRNAAEAEGEIKEAQAAAGALGLTLQVLRASNVEEIEAVFRSLRELHVGALAVASDPFLFGSRDRLIALADRDRMPVVGYVREFAVAGGLASYGTSLADALRQVGIYTGRILKGEKPADLPVVQSTKFELVLNLKTARALGLTIPSGVLAIADEVIE